MGYEGVGQLRAAEPAQDLPVCGVAVIHHDVVVGALLVRLQLELGEPQLDPVASRGGEYPDTLLPILVTVSQDSLVARVLHLFSWIIVRVVRTGEFSLGAPNLVLASSLAQSSDNAVFTISY